MGLTSAFAETRDSDHVHRHNGSYFVHSGEVALTASGGLTPSISHLLRIPADVWIKLVGLRFTINSGDLKVYLYEAPTTTATGALHAGVNVKRYSPRQSAMIISHTPTITANGLFLDGFEASGTVQTGSQGGSAVAEFLLAPATDYLILMTNVSNQALNLFYQFEFIEEHRAEPEIF
jgi:hypothetical protein